MYVRRFISWKVLIEFQRTRVFILSQVATAATAEGTQAPCIKSQQRAAVRVCRGEMLGV